MTNNDTFDGLYSQTQIRHLMKTEFSRAKRYKYELTCLLLEISGIGAFRDHLGFEAKEDLCSDFVTHLRVETRTCDYLGRMMDDKFLVILPHTGVEGTSALIGRLRTMLGTIELPEGAPTNGLALTSGSTHFNEGAPMFFDALLDGAEAALLSAEPGAHVSKKSTPK
ncbi:MAG: diguanylate cyclase (GGDEF)-like protein [Planctomycetota bacterium]|jgi:diguanylate cyclase (GGDEF)-like protein